MSCVFGYTIGNDVSERSWQKADRGLWRAKNADTFKADGAVDRDLGRSRQHGNHRQGEWQGKQPLPYQRHDLRHRAVHRRADEIFYIVAGRRDLDGPPMAPRPTSRPATWWRLRSPASARCAIDSSRRRRRPASNAPRCRGRERQVRPRLRRRPGASSRRKLRAISRPRRRPCRWRRPGHRCPRCSRPRRSACRPRPAEIRRGLRPAWDRAC